MKKINRESYLVLLIEIKKAKYIYTFVPGNKEMSMLYSILNPITHMIASVTPLVDVQDFKEVYRLLNDSNKPENLEFGKE